MILSSGCQAGSYTRVFTYTSLNYSITRTGTYIDPPLSKQSIVFLLFAALFPDRTTRTYVTQLRTRLPGTYARPQY